MYSQRKGLLSFHSRFVRSILTPLESQQRLTQLTQHATHESKTKYILLYAKGHSSVLLPHGRNVFFTKLEQTHAKKILKVGS